MSQILLWKDRDFLSGFLKKENEEKSSYVIRHASETKCQGKAWKQTDGERETSQALNKRGEEIIYQTTHQFKSKILNRTTQNLSIIKHHTPWRRIFTHLVTKPQLHKTKPVVDGENNLKIHNYNTIF